MAATSRAPPRLTRVARALYRSLVPLALSLDTSPLLRLFVLPPGQDPPSFFPSSLGLTSSNSSTLSTLQLLRDCFRAPPSGMDESHAFTALRGLNVLRSKLGELGGVEGTYTPPARTVSSPLFRCSSTHLDDWLPKGDGSAYAVPHGSISPGTLLVSHPSLSPPFHHSVILLLAAHPEEGCVGVVLNGGEQLPSTHAPSNTEPLQQQEREVYPPSSPSVPSLSFSPPSPPLHPTHLYPTGRASPAQRHPYTNLHTLRYYASPKAQFTLSGGEIAVGAMRAVGVHSLLHPSGLCAVVGGRFGVDDDNEEEEEEMGEVSTASLAAPRRTEGVLPIGPGLDAPSPPWVKKAAKAWLVNPAHQHLLKYSHWQKQQQSLSGSSSNSSSSDSSRRGGGGGGAEGEIILPLNPLPPGGGVSPLYGRIFSHLSLSQRRHRLRSQGYPQEQQRQQSDDGGGGGGGGGGVGRWFGKQVLKVSYTFEAGGGRHGVSAFDASPSVASIAGRKGGKEGGVGGCVVEKGEEEDMEEEVEGVTMPPSVPSSLPLWGTDDDAEHFGDVTWGLGGGGDSATTNSLGSGATFPSTTFSSPAFFTSTSPPHIPFSSLRSSGVREDREDEEGDEEEGEEDEGVGEEEDEEFELLVGLKKAGEGEGDGRGSVGEIMDEGETSTADTSSYSSYFARRRLRRSSSGVMGGGGTSGFFSRLSSPLPTLSSRSSGGSGSGWRAQKEVNQHQHQQQQQQGLWGGGRRGRRSNATLSPPSYKYSQSRGQLAHSLSQHLLGLPPQQPLGSGSGDNDGDVGGGVSPSAPTTPAAFTQCTLPVYVTMPASFSQRARAAQGGGLGSRVVEGALHYYPYGATPSLLGGVPGSAGAAAAAGAPTATPTVMCEGGARLLPLPLIRRLARALHVLVQKGEGGGLVVAPAQAALAVTEDDQSGALPPTHPPSFSYYSGVVPPSSTAAAAKLGGGAGKQPTPPVIKWGGPVDTVPFSLTRVSHNPLEETPLGAAVGTGGLPRGGRRRGGSFSTSPFNNSALEGWGGEDGGEGGEEEGITFQPPILGRVGHMPPSRIRIQAGSTGTGAGTGTGGGRHSVYSGLSTWAPGQLESELREGVWYTVVVEDVWGKGVVGGGGSEGVRKGLWGSVLRAVGGWHGKVAEVGNPTTPSTTTTTTGSPV